MFNTFFPIILLIVSGLVGFVYIEPTYTSIKGLQEQEVQIDRSVVRAKDIVRITEELSASINSINPIDIEKLDIILPREIDEVRFVYMLSTIAGRQGLSIEGVSVLDSEPEPVTLLGGIPAPVSNEPRVQTLDVQFTLLASYEAFRAFLADLEKSLVIMDVNSLSLGAGSKENEYSYQISISTYWMN